MNFEHAAPIFEKMVFSHPRTQPILRSLLGEEPILFQSMALLKPPGGVEKPWHQDNAYFSTENPQGVIGTWIALDDASVANGCMHFLPGGHLRGPLKHHHTSDCEIMTGRFDVSQAVPVPLRAGGIIFFHGNIPHQTPPNHSNQRRRALQFHYRAASNQNVARDIYDQIFCESDGTPASCAAAIPQNL
jgi:phytanoyl-CoA hydroxylase